MNRVGALNSLILPTKKLLRASSSSSTSSLATRQMLYSLLQQQQQRRSLCMSARLASLNLQEYQSKTLMQEAGCSVQPFFLVSEAETKFTEEYAEYVVKAQVLAGGRGKGRFSQNGEGGGGIHITTCPVKAETAAKRMLGRRLITAQTMELGLLVRKCMVADSFPIVKTRYLAFLHDLEHGRPVVISSREGGVDIEEVAQRDPQLIHREFVDNVDRGLSEEQAAKIASFLDFSKGSAEKAAAEEILRLYHLFIEKDAVLLEVNPFAEIEGGTVCCIDAKMSLDESARFRHEELFSRLEEERHENEEMNPLEVEAKRTHLNYVGLDGNIACMVNGAGLAMATMDIIALCGGRPANFLDVGGGVTQTQVHQAFSILLADKRVRVMWVNIFGGIVNCEVIARGIIEAIRDLEKKIPLVPLVVRLQGTRAIEAMELLEKEFPSSSGGSGVESSSTSTTPNIRVEADFAKAAKAAVETAEMRENA